MNEKISRLLYLPGYLALCLYGIEEIQEDIQENIQEDVREDIQ